MEFRVNNLEDMCNLMCGAVEEEDMSITNTFATNVLEILKHDKIKVGQFEKEHGLPAGAISRKARSNSSIGLDLAYAIADDLETTVDDIISTDWTDIFDKEDREAELNRLIDEQKTLEARIKELQNV